MQEGLCSGALHEKSLFSRVYCAEKAAEREFLVKSSAERTLSHFFAMGALLVRTNARNEQVKMHLEKFRAGYRSVCPFRFAFKNTAP